MSQMPLAKKQLGQHWLEDSDSLRALVEAANIKNDDTVFEIGPGTGTLTQELLNTGVKTVALEFDEQRFADLKIKYKDSRQIKIISGDIREFDFSSLPGDYKIVANIPYYLTANLFRILTLITNKPTTAVLLVQKEVAQRVCATPGKLSKVAVFTQLFYEPCFGKVIPANLFTPPPKVDSQILVLQRRSKPFAVLDGNLEKLINAGFGQKRKKLKTNLSAGLMIDKKKITEIMLTAGFSENTRAQELSLYDWVKLAGLVNNS
jgi:16S rRNA (adenine1518-N6/adenine1519-N6)-dimethyltransferase